MMQTQTDGATQVINEWLVAARSGIHGQGLFARRAIPAGTPVIEYVGQRISKAASREQCDANNVYVFTLDETWDLDGNVDWNPARWVNHSCAPNCDAELDAGRIWVVARREIPAGEEITFNYGYDIEEYHDYPCVCGVPECVGFIVAEEYFPLVRRRREATAP